MKSQSSLDQPIKKFLIVLGVLLTIYSCFIGAGIFKLFMSEDIYSLIEFWLENYVPVYWIIQLHFIYCVFVITINQTDKCLWKWIVFPSILEILLFLTIYMALLKDYDNIIVPSIAAFIVLPQFLFLLLWHRLRKPRHSQKNTEFLIS